MNIHCCNVLNKTSYREDFCKLKQYGHTKVFPRRPTDMLSINDKTYKDPFFSCKYKDHVELIEKQLDAYKCTSDLWNTVRQRITSVHCRNQCYEDPTPKVFAFEQRNHIKCAKPDMPNSKLSMDLDACDFPQEYCDQSDSIPLIRPQFNPVKYCDIKDCPQNISTEYLTNICDPSFCYNYMPQTRRADPTRCEIKGFAGF